MSNSISSVSDFSIADGELNEVQQLQSLSKYLKVEDLKHLHFAALKNTIEIHDRKMVMPEMSIHSNALNVTFSGIHTFDNDIDYLVKVNMLEVFARKMGKANDESWEQDDNKSGFNIFLRMTGKASDAKISINKKASRQKFKENLKAEQQTIKQLIQADLKGIAPAEKAIDFKPQDKVELIDWNDSLK